MLKTYKFYSKCQNTNNYNKKQSSKCLINFSDISVKIFDLLEVFIFLLITEYWVFVNCQHVSVAQDMHIVLTKANA